MATDTTLTSVILNPWSTSTTPYTGSPADQLIIPYADLGFVASASDSYKSTAGDIFKIYVDGVRIYRTSDSLYAGGAEFLEDGDIRILPYFEFDLNLDLKKINFYKLHNFFINLDEKSKKKSYSSSLKILYTPTI